MIKSKIDARDRALEFALGLVNKVVIDKCNFLQWAGKIEKYLLGDAELPEVQSDGDMIKAFLDIANNEIEKSRERNNRDLEELIKTLKERDASISAEVPCKSENE